MILTGKTEVLSEKPVLVPLCLQQILHGLAWNPTWASAARYRLTNRLSHSTTVLFPQYLIIYKNFIRTSQRTQCASIKITKKS